MSGQAFRFVRLEFPGELGIPDGRYLVREQGTLEGASEDDKAGARFVLAISGGVPAPRRRLPMRRRRPVKDADEGGDEGVAVTVVLVIAAEALEDERVARSWLEELIADEPALEAELVAAVGVLNEALHANATARLDPYGPQVDLRRTHAVRVGFGSGHELAEDEWTEARLISVAQLGRERERTRRSTLLLPQERLAAVLGGRERVPASETFVLRARADLDAGRELEAAVGLKATIELLLSELGTSEDDAVRADAEALKARRELTEAAAAEAGAGPLSPERSTELAETLRLAERAAKRRHATRRGTLG